MLAHTHACDNTHSGRYVRPTVRPSAGIYDHSIFEAFSKVVQRMIPCMPTLENLLNCLIGNCAMEKAFLFDVSDDDQQLATVNNERLNDDDDDACVCRSFCFVLRSRCGVGFVT